VVPLQVPFQNFYGVSEQKHDDSQDGWVSGRNLNLGDSINSSEYKVASRVYRITRQNILHLLNTRTTHRPLMPSLIPSATVGIITSYRRRRTKKNVHLNANQDVRIM